MKVLNEEQQQLSKQALREAEQEKRSEDPRHITGTGTFVDDLKVRRMVYACLLRSPYAHAKIKRIDFEKAKSLPGVIEVVTGADAITFTKPFPQAFDFPVQDYCLAPSEVVYVGQPVAAVVAESLSLAEDGVSLIDVEYEALTPITDAHQGALEKSKLTHLSLNENCIFHKVLTYGNVAQAFSQADLILDEAFVFESYSAVPLETYGILADYNKATGQLLIQDNCQMPLVSLASVSHALSIPSNKIRFVERDIGGGFGIKGMLPIYDVLVSLLSIKTGLPVKWIETRSEHMMASSHGTRRQFEARLAVRKSGQILGLKLRVFEDVGAFVRRPGHTALVSPLRAFCGPYNFKAFEYDMNMVLTNKCPAGPSRGNGKNHHAFLLERLVDRVASRLNLDPVTVRLNNFITPKELPYLTPNGCLYDSGDYPKALTRLTELIHYPKAREEQRKARSEGRYIGIGLALTLDPAASNTAQDAIFHEEGTTTRWGTSDAASIHMDSSGSVTIALTSVPQGQGHESVASRLVADRLGVNPEQVTVFTGFDSSRNLGTPTSGTYSSRFAAVEANAVALAAMKLREKLLRIASNVLQVPAEQLALGNNQVFHKDKDSVRISIKELATIAYSGLPGQVPPDEERSLDSVVTYTYPFGRNAKEAISNLASTYAYQAHAAIVEVDIETGVAKILSYAVVDDSGKSLNRTIVEGQVHGGTCNGIAAALYECYLYNSEGQLLSSTFNDYLAPSAMEIPNMKLELMETPTPFTPTGAKGVGESGALGPQPAIINAIEDALRGRNVQLQRSHVTPENIYFQLRKE